MKIEGGMLHLSSEKAAKVVVVGSANIDLFFKTETLPLPGETIAASDAKRSFGGKGANQAVTVAKIGGGAVMVCRVGMDESRNELLENFNRFGVDTRFVIRDPERSSGMAFVTVDKNGENTIVIYSGANGKLCPHDVEGAVDVIKSGHIVVTQLEIPLETVRRTAVIAREMNVPFILNPAPAPSKSILDILEYVDVLCPNKTEATALTGLSVDGIEGAEAAGRKILQFGVKTVVLTLGASGALLVQEGGAEHIPSPTVTVRDTTGAGDAFVGALAYSLATGSCVTDAVKFANVAASISVTKDGTQAGLPTREEIETLKRKFFSDE